jgi:hypothetical protein
MPRIARGILWGGAAVIGFDLLGSLASEVLGFEYGVLAIGSLLIYGAVGAYVGQHEPVRRAAAAGLGVGAIDATLGWAVSWVIGPGRPEPGDPPVIAVFLAGAVLALLMAAFASSVGGWIAGRRRAWS